MCQSPATLADGTVIACRKCPQCRDLKIADWVGRNIAEQKTASKTFAVTLTYGRVKNEVLHSHAVALFYSDVQKYLKLLRRHRYSVRYFVTGEFGGLKGRTHWHIVLHFKGAVPPHVLEENFDQEQWPHGFSYWTEAHARTVQYNCKYIQKDLDDAEAQGHLAMSKKPPLGFEYFSERARSAARQGVHLRNLDYSFPDVRFVKGDRVGQRKPFRLTGKSACLYVEEYIDEWLKVQTLPLPKNEFLSLYGYDPREKPGMRVTRLGWVSELQRIKERRQDKPAVYTRLELLKLQRDDDRVHEILKKHRPVTEFVTPLHYQPITDAQKQEHLRKVRANLKRAIEKEERGGYEPWVYFDDDGTVKEKWVWKGRDEDRALLNWELTFEKDFERGEKQRQEFERSSAGAQHAADRSEYYEGKRNRVPIHGTTPKPKRAGR